MTPEMLEEVAAEIRGQKSAKEVACEVPPNALLFCPDCGDVHKHKIAPDPKKRGVSAVQCLKCNKIGKMETSAIVRWLEFRKR